MGIMGLGEAEGGRMATVSMVWCGVCVVFVNFDEEGGGLFFK